MTLPVILSDRVGVEMQDAHDWWAEHHSPEQAARWYDGLITALRGLETGATSKTIAAESAQFPFEVRELHFGLGRRPTHRVLFTIRPDSVYVLAVRHVSREPLGPDDLP